MATLVWALRRRRPRRHFVVHGFYGAGNVGDELILRATIEAFRERTGLEPLVFAWNPEHVREEYGVEAVDPRRMTRLGMVRLLAGSGLFLLGGGGLIKDYGGSPKSLERWLRWIDVAARAGIPTATWSVGVDPLRFDESRDRVREVFGRLGVVSVRDEASAERLAELGIQREVLVGADPVHLLARPRVTSSRDRTAPRVAFCLRHWFVEANRTHDGPAFDRLLASLAALADSLIRRSGATIRFVPLQTSSGDDDRVVAREVIARMVNSGEGVQLVETSAPGAVLDEIELADLVVAMRLHAAILATSIGIPTLGIGYAPKVVDYMAAIGQSEFCLPVESVTSDWLFEASGKLLSEPDRVSAALIGETSRRARRVEEVADAIAGLLTRLARGRHSAVEPRDLS